jgi:biopolymer transport protein ExbB
MKTALSLRSSLLGCALFAGAATALFAQTEEASTEAAPTGGASLLDLIAQGGWAMWPLGLLMLAMFYLVFHCFAQTGGKRFVPANLETLSQPLAQRDYDAARQSFANNDTALGRLMALSLNKVRPDRPDLNREGMEAAFIEGAEGEENAVGQWINYLNVIATVAPMVGLLGTVSGMISAFQTIGQGGMGKPEALAGDIGEALITTATGLVIGIPAMIAYFYFRNRLTSQMINVGQTGGVLFDVAERAEREKAS